MISSSSTSHVWRCYKLILSLVECSGSTFVRDLKNDETNEVENAYGIFIRSLLSFHYCKFFPVVIIIKLGRKNILFEIHYVSNTSFKIKRFILCFD